MTREEKLASIYRGGTVYRPLQEENSILLEVQLGCSWHKCHFRSAAYFWVYPPLSPLGQ